MNGFQTKAWSWRCRLVYLGVCFFLLLSAGAGVYVSYRWLRADHYFRAAERARQDGQLAEARQLAQTSLEFWSGEPRTHFLQARIARHAERYEEAERQLDLCQRGEGATERIALERTLLLVQQGCFSRELEVRVRDYLQRNHPDSDEILAALSKGCIACYLLENALGYLSAWLERQPENAQAHLWRGTVRERIVDMDGAEEDYLAAIDLAANNRPLVRSEARLRLAQVWLVRNEIQQAAELFEQLHREQPERAVAAVGLAQCHGKLDHPEEAARLLDELVARYPQEAPILLERGRLALQMGRAAAAEGWLRQATALTPWDYATQYTLLVCLGQQGKEAAAREVQERVRRLEEEGVQVTRLTEQMVQRPYDLAIRCDLARAFLRQGQDQEAVLWLRSALKIDPRYHPANQLLVDYYENRGEPALARPYREMVSSP